MCKPNGLPWIHTDVAEWDFVNTSVNLTHIDSAGATCLRKYSQWEDLWSMMKKVAKSGPMEFSNKWHPWRNEYSHTLPSLCWLYESKNMTLHAHRVQRRELVLFLHSHIWEEHYSLRTFLPGMISQCSLGDMVFQEIFGCQLIASTTVLEKAWFKLAVQASKWFRDL